MIKAKETGNGTTIKKDELRSTGFTGREYALVWGKMICAVAPLVTVLETSRSST